MISYINCSQQPFITHHLYPFRTYMLECSRTIMYIIGNEAKWSSQLRNLDPGEMNLSGEVRLEVGVAQGPVHCHTHVHLHDQECISLRGKFCTGKCF
jgi:hypothetical protein